MLPSSLLLLTLSILAPLTSASSSSPQKCSPSTTTLDTPHFNSSYTTFCSSDPISTRSDPALDLTYIAAKDSGCGRDDCLRSFEGLLLMCRNNNQTITGTGSSDEACGIFGFAIKSTSVLETGSSTVIPGASRTGKPDVGPTALGTSGASLVRISGGLMIGVAGVFYCFL